MTSPSPDSLVLQLSQKQLNAYNQNDIDAFCACYHSDIVVLDAQGQIRVRGMDAFRQRYQSLFEQYQVEATVNNRVCLPPHIVEYETWQRTHRDTGEVTQGAVLVRYQERDGLLAIAQFWSADDR